MVQIKFIRQGSNSMLGGFSSGDTARVSDALAAHLVNEAGVAEYYDPVRPADAQREVLIEKGEQKIAAARRSRNKAAS